MYPSIFRPLALSLSLYLLLSPSLSPPPPPPLSLKQHHIPPLPSSKLHFFFLSHILDNLQIFIDNLCSLFITPQLPFQWRKVNICLLRHKSNPDKPTNYRPIALLNTPYKVPISYGATTLTYYARTYKLTNNSQNGGLPCQPTTGHINSRIANCKILTNSTYIVYLDLNINFNFTTPYGAYITHTLQLQLLPIYYHIHKQPLCNHGICAT